MKVLVLSTHTKSLYRFRMDMMKDFMRANYEVVAVGEEYSDEIINDFSSEGIVYKSIPIKRNSLNPFNDLRVITSIVRLLTEERPDKVFAFFAKAVTYGGLACRWLGIKEFYPMIAGVGSVFLGTGLKNSIIRRILVTQYKVGLKKAAAYFFQNNDDVVLFEQYGIIDKQKVSMTNGSGVNTSIFYPTPLPSVPTFLCVSRLIKDKGVTEYLEACREVKKIHPEVKCLLVGPFDSNPSAIKKTELDSYIKDGAIEYFGEQTDVFKYISMASVFILPSYREGTPKSVLEAMSCARAIITTDAPGCRETIVDGYNGFMVPVKNVSAIVDAMCKYIDEESLVTRHGKRGREMVEAKFDVRLVNATILRTMGINDFNCR